MWTRNTNTNTNANINANTNTIATTNMNVLFRWGRAANEEARAKREARLVEIGDIKNIPVSNFVRIDQRTIGFYHYRILVEKLLTMHCNGSIIFPSQAGVFVIWVIEYFFVRLARSVMLQPTSQSDINQRWSLLQSDLISNRSNRGGVSSVAI